MRRENIQRRPTALRSDFHWSAAGLFNKNRLRRRRIAVALAIALLSAQSADAADFTWDGLNGATPSSDWNTANNWVGGVVPTLGSTFTNDRLVIANSTNGAGAIYNPGAGVTTTFGSGRALVIGQSGIGAGALTISSGTIRTTGGANSPIMSNAVNSTLLINGGTLDVTGNTNAFQQIFNGANGLTSTFTISSGAFTGNGFDLFNSLTNSGSGTLNLNGGTFGVTGFSRSLTTGTGTSAINFNGGVLQARGASTTFLNSLTNTTTNVLTGGARIDTNGNNISIGANLLGSTGDGGLQKTGNGVLTLTGNNTYNGSTTITTGGIAVSNANALGSTSGGTTVSDGAWIALSGNVTFAAETVTIAGDGTGFRGALQSAIGANTWTGNVLFSGNGNNRIGVQDGASLTITGNITETAANSRIIFRPGGTSGSDITVSGSGNAWTGTTEVWGGNGVLKLGRINALPTTSLLSLGNGTSVGGTVDLNGFNQTSAGLSQFGGNLGSLVNNGSNDATLMLQGLATDYTFDGTIRNGISNKVALTMNSAGRTQTLSGNHTYTGPTNITAGTLAINGSTAAGSTVNVGTNGTLSGTGNIGGNATLTGNGIINKSAGNIDGTLSVTGGNWNGAGSVTGEVTSSSGTFTIGSGANLTANGGLNVTGGTIAAAASNSTITGRLNYTSSSNSTFAGTIAGSGNTVTMNAAGSTLTLNGANTYTGATNITAGTLAVNGSTAAGSTVIVGTSGTLSGTGNIGGNATLTGNGIINKSAGNIAGTLSVTGGHWNGAGAVGGVVTSSSGAFTIGNGANLTANSGVNVTGGTIAAASSTSTITGSVNYTSSANSTFAGVIAGTGNALTLNNANANLTLTGASTYTGGTNVLAGTLLVNNSVGSGTGAGSVSVASGATLGGTGSIAGDVTVAGTLSPGASIESLTTGSVSFLDNSTFKYEFNSLSLNNQLPLNSGDLLNVNGNLFLNNNVTLSLLDMAQPPDSVLNDFKLTLISYSGSWTGIFNGLADDSLFTSGLNTWRINYNDTIGGANFGGGDYNHYVTLTAVAVPEPNSIVFGIAGGVVGMILHKRRRKGGRQIAVQSNFKQST